MPREPPHRRRVARGDRLARGVAAVGDDLAAAAPHAIDQRIADGEDPRVENLVAAAAGERRMVGAQADEVGRSAGRSAPLGRAERLRAARERALVKGAAGRAAGERADVAGASRAAAARIRAV